MTSTYGTQEEYAAFAAKQDEAERSSQSTPAYFANDATLACIAELERENAELKQLLESARAIALSKQAKIDALMLEYCRNEIPQEQLKEWARHQRPVDAETTAVIDAAIASKKENDRG